MWKHVIVFVAGLTVGLLLSAAYRIGGGTSAHEPRAADRASESGEAGRRPELPIGLLTQPLEGGTDAEADGGQIDLSPAAAGRSRLLILDSLVRQELARVTPRVRSGLGNDPRLTDEFVSLFYLDAAERRRIEDVIRFGLAESERLQLKHALAGPGSEGGWEIRVPAFPEEGGLVHDRVLGEVESVLGPERFAVFSRLWGGNNDDLLGDLGTHDRVIRISETPGPENTGKWYRYTDRSERSLSHTQSSGTAPREGVEERFGEIVRRNVPESFWER